MDPKKDGDLAFSLRATKGGDVTIFRGGIAVTVLRGESARHFLAKLNDATVVEQQALMARITGNYKRGNERLAARNSRNRSERSGR